MAKVMGYMLKTCLFDLDGTLVDTLDDLADTVEQVLTEYGIGNTDHTPVHSKEDYRRFVGNGMRKLVERAIGGRLSGEDENAAFSRFVQLYDRQCLVKTKPYDGIDALLDSLTRRGIRWGVVTNKNEEQAIRITKHFFSKYHPSCIYGGWAGRPSKPDPAALYAALSDCDADPASTLFIGDSDVDVQTAHNASLRCAGAAWGFRGEEELKKAGADHILRIPSDLLRLL